jgi:hypothetical protein
MPGLTPRFGLPERLSEQHENEKVASMHWNGSKLATYCFRVLDPLISIFGSLRFFGIQIARPNL